MATTRRREIPFGDYNGHETLNILNPPTSASFEHPYHIRGSQVTTSENHPDWATWSKLRQLHHDHKLITDGQKGALQILQDRDIGGPFTTTKNFYRGSHEDVYSTVAGGESPNFVRRYVGPFFAHNAAAIQNPNVWPVITPSTSSQMYAFGAQAIARTIPTNPVASLFLALAEFKKDGIPALPGKSVFRKMLLDYRKYGDEYLNTVFGWLPLIRDVKQTAGAIAHHDKVIAQFVRDSGRHIRRRYTFPASVVTEVTDLGLGGATPTLPTAFYSNNTMYQGPKRRTRVTETRRWFSGCYTYYLDPGITDAGKARRREQISNKLFGTRISPELLWNLQPWSWLADWEANIGDVMTNLTAFSNDGLVLRYGYMMEHITITDTYTLDGIVFKSGPLGTLTQVFGTEYKTRVKATPYGFGLTPSSFTSRQWAILAALGISRGPNML
jgi:hypothetical protein